MATKGWAIFMSSLYILYMLIILPWYFVFVFSSNGAKRGINKGIVNKELKKCGVPRDIRRASRKSYKNSVKILGIRRSIKLIQLARGRKKSKEIKKDKVTITVPN
ncbi:MAG: hypothetical protein KAS47_02525 [Candidatus Heimdallarchaeota archaeon]|nr:hypothetical protein [Candidatus Heimdallarchaeota archaeon]